MRHQNEEGIGRQNRIALVDLRLQLARDLGRFAVLDPKLIEAETRRADEHVFGMLADEAIQKLPRSGDVAPPCLKTGKIEISDVGGIRPAVLRLHIFELLFGGGVPLRFGLVLRAGLHLLLRSSRRKKRRLDRIDGDRQRVLRFLLSRGPIKVRAVGDQPRCDDGKGDHEEKRLILSGSGRQRADFVDKLVVFQFSAMFATHGRRTSE